MKRMSVGAIVGMIVLLLGTASHAEDPLKIEVIFGYNGVVPQNQELVPVRVFIKNKLKNLSGTIEFTQPDGHGSEVTLTQPFKSPSPSVRDYLLLPRLEPTGGLGGSGLRVTVRFDQKDVQDQWQVFGASNKTSEKLVLGVGLPDSFLKNQDANTKDYRTFFTSKYQIVRMSNRLLFSNPLAYDGIHSIIVTTPAISRLTNKQLSALERWVMSGGHLMLCSQGEFPAQLATFKGLKLDPKKVMSRPYHWGMVTHQPFTRKPVPFWIKKDYHKHARLLFPGMMDRSFDSRVVRAKGRFDALTARKDSSTYGFMGLVWLLLIIVAYCLVVGPLDWWLIRRLRRPWLTWPLFIVSILAFSYLAYWYSGVVHSLSMTALQVNVIDRSAGSDYQVGQSQLWIYSTGNFYFNLRSSLPDAKLSCRESVGALKSNMAQAEIRHGKNATIATRIPVFSSKTFGAKWQSGTPKAITESKIEGKRVFTCPENWQIKAAYLASSRGAEQLVVDQNRLRSTGVPRAWSSWHADWSQPHVDAKTKLPTEHGLRRYMLSMSFASLNSEESVMEIEHDAVRNQQERHMDISNALRPGNRVLMIFLAEESTLHEITIDRLIPRKIHCNLIRYRLPPAH